MSIRDIRGRLGICSELSDRVTGCYNPFTMRIIVNGKPQDHPDPTTITDLITRHHLTPDKVAIELNRRLVRSDKYATVLKENDEVEIVTFVGGG